MAQAIAQARRIRETEGNMIPKEQRDAKNCATIINDALRHGHLDSQYAAQLMQIRAPGMRLDACRGIAELNRAADHFNCRAGAALKAEILTPSEHKKLKGIKDPAERLKKLQGRLAELVD